MNKLKQLRRHFLLPLALIMGIFLMGGLLLPAAVRAQATYPTFTISSVVAGQTVTIHAINLPANADFVVRMAPFGNRAEGGAQVTTINTGAGGTQNFTFAIPAGLSNLERIAIRMENYLYGYYAYNWFYNNTATVGNPPPAGPTPTPVPPPTNNGSTPPPVVTTIPTFRVIAVVRNQTVTIRTSNLPANLDFVVRMNFMGTQGVNGTVVTTVNSGAGGTQDFTFAIPAAYANQAQIAIRMDNAATGAYAFNWFYNYTATVN